MFRKTRVSPEAVSPGQTGPLRPAVAQPAAAALTPLAQSSVQSSTQSSAPPPVSVPVPSGAPMVPPVDPDLGQPIAPGMAEAAQLDLDGVSDAAMIDFDALEDEWTALGAFSEETYERLAGAGIPRAIVDRYVEGQLAMGAALREKLLASIGGEEGFARLSEWARRSLPVEEIEAYEAALQGTPEQAQLALKALEAAWRESAGRRPQLVGGRRGDDRVGMFTTPEQVAEAMRDPRYKRDAGYRAEVAARLERSNVFRRRA